MAVISRRDALAIGAGSLAAASLGPPALADDPALPECPIEKGARLRVIRPARFVDPDAAVWNDNTRKFTRATGVPVRLSYLEWEDLRPETAVIADTGGADIVVGWSDDSQIYAPRLLDMTDLANYLGRKYGGWKMQARVFGRKWQSRDWPCIPIGAADAPCNYRISWVEEAGFGEIPADLDRFLALCRKLKENGHPPGFSLGNAVGDANSYANWLLWSHGAWLLDEDGRVAINRRQTIEALKYAKALQATFVSGTLAWSDASNNKAFLAGQIGLTQNGVSIYFAAKGNPKTRAIADDMDHAPMPLGLAHAIPQAPLVISAMVFEHTRFPNAAREYIRFMMEAEQYEPWLNASLGYWGHTLNAFDDCKVWSTDPKLALFRHAGDREFWTSYKGPVSAASGAVAANYLIVRMFASVASGDASPEEAAREAEQQARRYFRG